MHDRLRRKVLVFALSSPIEDLATPYLRGEAELRGEGRDCLEQVRRRVNPSTRDRAMEWPRASASPSPYLGDDEDQPEVKWVGWAARDYSVGRRKIVSSSVTGALTAGEMAVPRAGDGSAAVVFRSFPMGTHAELRRQTTSETGPRLSTNFSVFTSIFCNIVSITLLRRAFSSFGLPQSARHSS